MEKPRLELRLLGGFAARVDGVERADENWPTQRALQLVQLLALADGHRLPREQLIDTLWPQLDTEAGAANLRKAAHHARQALGASEAVQLQGGLVALWPTAALHVDALAFEHQARAALALADAADRAAACARAAGLYRGELLPAARFEAWAEPARTRLRGLQLQLLRAAGDWQGVVALDPADEAAHCALIEAELAAGNRAAAIRLYARLQQALQQELGMAPGPAAQALYARCLAGLRSAAPPPLIGRELMLAQAAAWLDMVAVGRVDRTVGLLLRGPAGIGKSAGLRAIDGLARARGWQVLALECAGMGRPYALATALSERLLLADKGLLDRVGAPARGVLALLSPLAGPAAALPGPLGRHQVVGALRRLLLAAGQPLLLVLDEVQRVDEADADLLLQLLDAGQPLLLALRPGGSATLRRGLQRLQEGGRLQAIELGALDADDARVLLQRAAGKPLDAATEARCLALAAGNPFATLALAACATSLRAGRLPASSAEAITARLLDLPQAALDMLKSLALSGEDFDAQTATALAAPEVEMACSLLDGALACGVLVLDEGRYRFESELVRQALIEQLPPHSRLRLHRQAARQLAALAVPAMVVARHWLLAGHPADALPWLLAAAREALRLAAFGDALRALEPLLDFEPRHAEALRLRAEALDALGDPAAPAAYRSAAEFDAEQADDLRAKAALAQIKLGDAQGALRAVGGLSPRSVAGRLAEALTYSGAAALGATSPEQGTAKAAEARRLALESGDAAAIVIASWAQAAAAHARGELHRSVWADLQETAHVPYLATRVFDGQLCITQRFLYGARPYAQVIEFANALSAEAQRLGAARGHAFGVTLRGEAELLSGDLDAAEQHLQLGARLHRAIGGNTGEAFSLQRLAELALARGRLPEARERLDAALDIARQTDIGFHLLDRIYGTRLQLAETPQAALRELAQAREAVRGPLETCPGCRITFAVPAAIAAARGGDLAQAADLERQCAYLADVVMRLPAWYAAHDEVRGHCAQAEQQTESAGLYFATAARRFREAGQPLDARRCAALAGAAA